MDGAEGPLKDSLQFRLSLWLSVSILGVALVSAAVSVAVAYNEAHEFQDEMLRQTASLFDEDHLPSARSRAADDALDADPEARVIVPLVSSGQTGGAAEQRPAFPGSLAAGAQTVELEGVPWRAFVQVLDSGEQIVAAQQTEVRNEAARDTALRALIPILVLVPVLLAVVAGVIRGLFAPIARTAGDLDQRSGEDLEPVPLAGMPTEIRPFLTAINNLLERVRESVSMQRRFVATAAHELRSPLTALSLQAERLAASDMPDAASQRVATLRRGIERNRWLVEQLLTLARAQATVRPEAATTSVREAFRAVLEDLMPVIESRRIDIGLEGDSDPRVTMCEPDLQAVVRNLVGNAIQYTPPGGSVALACTQADGIVELVVEDSGPGIAASQRERVFEAFHRHAGSDEPGSGLGLSIVRTLVQRAGGRVQLDAARGFRSGLRVSVRVPPAPTTDGHR